MPLPAIAVLGAKVLTPVIGSLISKIGGKQDPQKHKADILDSMKGAQDRINQGFKVAEMTERLNGYKWNIQDSKAGLLRGDFPPDRDGFSLIAYDEIQAEYAQKQQQQVSASINAQQQMSIGKVVEYNPVTGQTEVKTNPLVYVAAAAFIGLIVYLITKK